MLTLGSTSFQKSTVDVRRSKGYIVHVDLLLVVIKNAFLMVKIRLAIVSYNVFLINSY